MRRLGCTSAIFTALTAFAEEKKLVELSLEDQFDAKQDLKEHRGSVVVLIYGDRKSSDSTKSLGEKLHNAYHPTAKGKDPKEARLAPVIPLPGTKAGTPSPNVLIVPVACIIKVKDRLQGIVKKELKKISPEVPVWLDVGMTLKDRYGMKEGEPNLLVIDAKGHLRFKVQGELDEKTQKKLVEVIDGLRVEAAK